MTRRSVVRRVRGAGRRLAAHARQLAPPALIARARVARQRAETERLLAALPAAGRLTTTPSSVLVDAMYDNPNYWIRYALLRAALGWRGEVGVLGPYRSREARRTLHRLGVSETARLDARRRPDVDRSAEARRLLGATATAADILQWRLPEEFPPDFVYDGLLKRQRAAVVDLGDSRLPEYVAEALESIVAARHLVESRRFDAVVLSHAVNFQFASLAWVALRRRIPVLLVQGCYGVSRFARLDSPRDIYNTVDRPSGRDLDGLDGERASRLAAAGRAYIERRLAGHTEDLGALYAFQRAADMPGRDAIVRNFGWDGERPIIAVYASNWFDFPHPCGMTQFRDFLDWMRATLDAAIANRRVNWLFKAHPCDAWYGGVTLSDLVPPLDRYRHVRLVPSAWNGSAVLRAADGLVTVHGTAGIEFAAAGKPVLVADRGWYDDAGFVRSPRTREEYVDALSGDWWKDLDLDVSARRAQMFAGWYFGRPAWHERFVFEDDPRQAEIYRTAPALLTGSPRALARELETIRAWFTSGRRHYHTFKMSLANDFTV